MEEGGQKGEVVELVEGEGVELVEGELVEVKLRGSGGVRIFIARHWLKGKVYSYYLLYAYLLFSLNNNLNLFFRSISILC